MKTISVRRTLVCALAIWVGANLSGPLHAQTQNRTDKSEIRAKRTDLGNVKRRLDNLQHDLEKTEASYAEASRAVADAEREVSKAARALRQTMAEHASVEQQLVTLEAEQRETEKRIDARQNELADWLRRNYMVGSASDIAALLAARDPNQFARDAYYLERIGRARLELIEGLRSDLQRRAEHLSQIAARRARLARLEEDRRGRQETLEQTHARRRESLEEIALMLKTQRERMNSLKADEAHLTQVVNTLVQQAIESEARAEAARRERAKTRERARQNSATTRPPQPDEKPPVEPVVAKVREAARPIPGGTGGADGANFVQLRGKLHFPVTGELIGSFGAPRAGQGTAWRGVFIRAASGTDVRAVSDGEVVFSEWLRGYGNLLIVDHGSGYLSIYGNNDALYKEAGDIVRSGEAIASVGASGAETESGLYFEIRHQGQALDPMQWVKLK